MKVKNDHSEIYDRRKLSQAKESYYTLTIRQSCLESNDQIPKHSVWYDADIHTL